MKGEHCSFAHLTRAAQRATFPSAAACAYELLTHSPARREFDMIGSARCYSLLLSQADSSFLKSPQVRSLSVRLCAC